MRRLSSFGKDEGGAAMIELALVGTFLTACVLNVAETAHYAYQASEVNAAAQAGAEAALNACDTAHTPATINCAGLNAAVTTAVQGTSLGSQVAINGAITEGYYCLTTAGALQKAGEASDKPADCSGVQNNTGGSPILYLQAPVTFTYQPIFPGLTIVQTFAAAITRTAWMRMA
jgi:Flp pilus assembly protein TadG